MNRLYPDPNKFWRPFFGQYSGRLSHTCQLLESLRYICFGIFIHFFTRLKPSILAFFQTFTIKGLVSCEHNICQMPRKENLFRTSLLDIQTPNCSDYNPFFLLQGFAKHVFGWVLFYEAYIKHLYVEHHVRVFECFQHLLEQI